MANTFKITITAADKATATVRKVKDSVAQFTRPLTQVRASMGALGRELGVDKMTKGLGRMAGAARVVAVRVAKAVATVAAIAGAGSIAGIAAMTREWSMMGLAVLRATSILDIATGKFQTLTGAAEAFGLERADMQSGLKSLGDTFENAAFGRDQQALMLMNRLQIGLHRTKNGSVDTARGLYDVADAIKNIKNVQAQGVVARTFGVENLLPFLQQGSAGIKQYEEAVRRSGAVLSGPALEQSQKFARGLIMLKLAVEGDSNAIMGQLIPSLAPLIGGMTKWAVANRDVIGLRVKEFITGLVAPLSAVAKGLGGVINGTVGWKGAGAILAALLAGKLLAALWGLTAPMAKVAWWLGVLIARSTYMAVTALPRLLLSAAALTEASGLPLLAKAFLTTGLAVDAMLGPLGLALIALTAVIAAMTWVDRHNAHPVGHNFGGRGTSLPSGGTGSTPQMRRGGYDAANAKKAMAFFQAKGLSKEQAAGIVGNFAWESGLRPDQQGDNGQAYGIEQLHPDRQRNFKRRMGKDIRGSSLDDQLAFAYWEFTQGDEKRAGDAIKKQNTVEGATDATNRALERPANPAASEASREYLAQNFFDQAGGAAKPAQADTLHIKLEGLPAGTKATVKSSTKPVTTVKVVPAMPTGTPAL